MQIVGKQGQDKVKTTQILRIGAEINEMQARRTQRINETQTWIFK